MKNKINSIFGVAAAAAFGLTVGLAGAAPRPDFSMSVPFEFVVSGKTMPAGDYQVFQASNETAMPTFLIRNKRTMRAAMAPASPSQAKQAGDAKAVFNCRESVCYFRELKTGGSMNYVVPLPKQTKAEYERSVAVGSQLATRAD